MEYDGNRKNSLLRDRSGNYLSINELTPLLEDLSYKVVNQEIVNGLYVSTVWLGVIHNNNSLFETIVFDNNTKQLYIERYPTEELAVLGHGKICHKITNGELFE